MSTYSGETGLLSCLCRTLCCCSTASACTTYIHSEGERKHPYIISRIGDLKATPTAPSASLLVVASALYCVGLLGAVDLEKPRETVRAGAGPDNTTDAGEKHRAVCRWQCTAFVAAPGRVSPVGDLICCAANMLACCLECAGFPEGAFGLTSTRLSSRLSWSFLQFPELVKLKSLVYTLQSSRVSVATPIIANSRYNSSPRAASVRWAAGVRSGRLGHSGRVGAVDRRRLSWHHSLKSGSSSSGSNTASSAEKWSVLGSTWRERTQGTVERVASGGGGIAAPRAAAGATRARHGKEGTPLCSSSLRIWCPFFFSFF